MADKSSIFEYCREAAENTAMQTDLSLTPEQALGGTPIISSEASMSLDFPFPLKKMDLMVWAAPAEDSAG